MSTDIKEKFNKMQDLLQSINDFKQLLYLYEEFSNIQKGHPAIDLIFDRMEEVDATKFEKFLNNELN